METERSIPSLILELLKDEWPHSTYEIIEYVLKHREASKQAIRVALSQLCKQGTLCNLNAPGELAHYILCNQSTYLQESIVDLREKLLQLSGYLDDASCRESKHVLFANHAMHNYINGLHETINPLLNLLNSLCTQNSLSAMPLDIFLKRYEKEEIKRRKDALENLILCAGIETIFTECAPEPIAVLPGEQEAVSALNVLTELNAALLEVTDNEPVTKALLAWTSCKAYAELDL